MGKGIGVDKRGGAWWIGGVYWEGGGWGLLWEWEVCAEEGSCGRRKSVGVSLSARGQPSSCSVPDS